ncbi:hypothetical protein IG612_05160 [Pectobacterium sp. FL60-S17]|uniref:Uncharacterized protein n=1 Tax=Pectobacterium quasiaquaticum TaxID=2774015 RepID=A0A9Q2EUN8_9GAMM|nr:hypothetical protein [Pectobacterium quasiaquaticum]MBE5202011.1 hypothetical protein [Pectobacterium quasiaquaticum]MBE5223089.1 hypothetical protein [Pectobacterium quasiaquaticum]URG50840.1 hypothetical protein IG609_010215 [Pectobacterium quasiaquaticum]
MKKIAHFPPIIQSLITPVMGMDGDEKKFKKTVDFVDGHTGNYGIKNRVDHLSSP